MILSMSMTLGRIHNPNNVPTSFCALDEHAMSIVACQLTKGSYVWWREDMSGGLTSVVLSR